MSANGEAGHQQDTSLIDIAREVRRCEQEVEMAERAAQGRRENLVAVRRHLSEAMCMRDFMHGWVSLTGRTGA